MNNQKKVSVWVLSFWKFGTILSIMLLCYSVMLKVSSIELISCYLDTAPSIGKLYAIDCKNVKSTRVFLKERIEKQTSHSFFDLFSVNAYYQRQYNQIVLDAFDKYIKLLNKNGSNANTQKVHGERGITVETSTIGETMDNAKAENPLQL